MRFMIFGIYVLSDNFVGCIFVIREHLKIVIGKLLGHNIFYYYVMTQVLNSPQISNNSANSTNFVLLYIKCNTKSFERQPLRSDLQMYEFTLRQPTTVVVFYSRAEITRNSGVLHSIL